MQLNLTFNKPAATMFFEGAKAVKLKIDGAGQISFRTSDKETGRGVYPLSTRTRGGLGITLAGKVADEFLSVTKMASDTHMAMEMKSGKWITAEAVEGKPSKVIPTARLWRYRDEIASKATHEKVARKSSRLQTA